MLGAPSKLFSGYSIATSPSVKKAYEEAARTVVRDYFIHRFRLQDFHAKKKGDVHNDSNE